LHLAKPFFHIAEEKSQKQLVFFPSTKLVCGIEQFTNMASNSTIRC